MIIEKIIIEGLLSYQTKQILDLKTINTALVMGQYDGNYLHSNGAGKSSLFEAIPICFFGKKGSRAQTLSELINDQSDTAYIEVIFNFEGNRYRKIRQWGKKNQNELHIYQNDKWEIQGSASEADNKLITLLGINPITFFSTVFFRQKGSLQFIDGNASDRKAILRELLNLHIYEDAYEVANKKHNELLKEKDILDHEQAGYSEKIEQYDEVKASIVETKEQMGLINEEIQKEQDALKAKNKELLKKETLFEKIKNSKQVRKEIEDQIKELSDQIEDNDDSIDDINNQIKTHKNKIKSKQDVLEKTNSDLEALEFELKTYEKYKKQKPILLEPKEEAIAIKQSELADLKIFQVKCGTQQQVILKKKEKFFSAKAICPVLETSCNLIDEESNKKYVNDLENQLKKNKKEQKNTTQQIDVVSEEIQVLQKEYQDCKEQNKDLEKKQNHRKTLITQYNALVDSLDNIEEMLEEYQSNITKCKKQIKEVNSSTGKLTKRLASLKIKLEEHTFDEEQYKAERNKIEQLKKVVEEHQETIEEKQNSLRNLDRQYGKQLSVLGEIKEVKRKRKENRLLIKELKNEIVIYQKLTKTFSKNGIQKVIMKNSVPLLENLSNKLLKRFSPNKEIYIKFDLDPTNKSGELKTQGGLDIIISEDGINKNLSLYSGGETTRITFSILLSIAELLSKRAGKRMQTLIIDERVSGLDEDGIMQFADIINLIKTKYEKLIIITHIPQLKDIFDDTIIINKTLESGSVIL